MTDRHRPATGTARRLARDLHDLGQEPAPAGLLTGILAATDLADAYFALDSPIGPIFVAYNAHGVSAVGHGDDDAAFAGLFERRFRRALRRTPSAPAALAGAVARRLRGERAALDLDLRGLTPFARATLEKATEIPRGEVRPYAWLAREIGQPGAVRAVGTALGNNPVPLLIPCHRIVRSDGAVGDYVFGTPAKRAALAAEGLDPDQLDALAARRVRYLGSDTTRIFCLPTCRNARRITAPHRVPFVSEAAARAAGYRPCRVCRP